MDSMNFSYSRTASAGVQCCAVLCLCPQLHTCTEVRAYPHHRSCLWNQLLRRLRWQQCCPPQGVARRQSVRLQAVAAAVVVVVAVVVAVAVAAVLPSHANLAT